MFRPSMLMFIEPLGSPLIDDVRGVTIASPDEAFANARGVVHLERALGLSPGYLSKVRHGAVRPSTQLVALLLQRGAPIEARSPNGTTALMMAAGYGSEDSVALLLAQHADATARNERGLNAADFARLAGRESLTKRLESRLR